MFRSSLPPLLQGMPLACKAFVDRRASGSRELGSAVWNGVATMSWDGLGWGRVRLDGIGSGRGGESAGYDGNKCGGVGWAIVVRWGWVWWGRRVGEGSGWEFVRVGRFSVSGRGGDGAGVKGGSCKLFWHGPWAGPGGQKNVLHDPVPESFT